MFGLPRCYAIGSKNGYARKHELLTTQSLFFHFQSNRPVAVALKNGVDYREEMDWCVFDIDNAEDFDATKQIAHDLSTFLSLEANVPHLITFSGGKGFHVWIFFDHGMPVDDVARFQFNIAQKLGWEEEAADEYRSGSTHIETLIASGKGKVVKLPFSLHPKKSGRWEVPLRVDDVLGFRPDGRHDMKRAFDIFCSVSRTYSATVEKLSLEVKDKYAHRHIAARGSNRRATYAVSETWTCPVTTLRQDEILAHIIATPCLRGCYEYIMGRQKGGYSQRVNLVVALAKAGFTRDEVAVFFRDNINDEEDNTHRGILEYQVGYWYPQTNLCACDIFQDHSKRNFCCPGYCGKSDPSRVGASFPDAPTPEKDILERCEEVLAMDGNVQVYKTTRAGATTSLILAAVKRSERVVILEPTNELCEHKLAQIMQVAATYPEIPAFKGIALTDNRKGCLKLAMKVNELRTEHRTDQTEWEKFPFALKPSCERCFYRHFPMPFEVMVPLAGSNIQRQECALIAAQERMGEASVVAMTYAKFNALMMSVDSEGGQATGLTSQLLTFDHFILDEFSHFVEAPSLDVTLKATWLGGSLAYNILDSLAVELRLLYDWKPENTSVQKIFETGQTFRGVILDALNEIDLDKKMVTQILREEDQMEIQINFTRYVKPLLDFMEARNMNVNHIFSELSMISQLPFAITKIRSIDFDEHVSAKKPGALEMAKNFVSMFKGKVIVTDATMPLADPADVLGVPFGKYNIGDPNGTAQHTRFFSDTWELRAPDLIDETTGVLNILISRILTVFKYYEPHDVFIVAPSILAAKFIRRALDERGYPAVNLTHQRSDKTIGRDSEYRVMLMIGSPFTPSEAFSWMTLFDKTADPEKIWYWNAMKWAFQSASRVKDPTGREASVVIGIGVPDYQARRFFNSQYIVNPPMTVAGLTDFEATVLRSVFWKRGEYKMTVDEVVTAKHLVAGEDVPGQQGDHIKSLMTTLRIAPRIATREQ